MCTRFYIDANFPDISVDPVSLQQSPLWNSFMQKDPGKLVTNGEVRPSDIAAVIAPDRKGEKTLYPMKWGYRLNDRLTLFNARTETAALKPTFREDWQRHRCIIPASCYFEWEHYKTPDGKKKTGDKYAIRPSSLQSVFLCGLYRIENGLPYFVVLTRDACPELLKIHNRMPLILPSEMIEDWIRPETRADALLGHALTSMEARRAN